MYDPVTFEVTWTSIPWEKEDQFPGQTIGGSPDVNFLSRSGRNDRNGDVWWVFDTISTRQGCRVVLPCYWRVRGGENGTDLVRASDGSKVGRLSVRGRHLPGPGGRTFVDISAKIDQQNGDVVVQYLTGGNGRSTEIIIPLPSGGNHSFVWGNGEDDRSRMHGGAESLPKRWFYCIGRKLGKGRKFGSSGSEVWGQPAAGHGMSDFGSSSWRVVSKETYARLLVAIPVADQAEIAA
jgi:hypothetical protein